MQNLILLETASHLVTKRSAKWEPRYSSVFAMEVTLDKLFSLSTYVFLRQLNKINITERQQELLRFVVCLETFLKPHCSRPDYQYPWWEDYHALLHSAIELLKTAHNVVGEHECSLPELARESLFSLTKPPACLDAALCFLQSNGDISDHLLCYKWNTVICRTFATWKTISWCPSH